MDTRRRGVAAILRDARSGKWRRFERAAEVISALSIEDVLPALAKVDEATKAGQRYAAGFVAYEAASSFDPALRTKAADTFPLLWFGIFETVTDLAPEELFGELRDPDPLDGLAWEPSITRSQYAAIFNTLQERIRDGDTYQVNFTYRLHSKVRSDPFAVFAALADSHRPPFGAFIDTGQWAICSASPELFFHADAGYLESRPMKGTSPRGLWFEQDLARARSLSESAKERAENVMIVDMVRNDMGRIAAPGTVRVASLFDVERYPTVLQLTSTISAETHASLTEIFRALFPAASITGAPKSRTMDLISELECSPRHVYTGTMGFVEPGGRAQFNVAIRTIAIDRSSGEAVYGTGGGVVADSVLDQEWQESVLKAGVLGSRLPRFDLLETMLWLPDDGYVLIGLHLKRLLQSADYFGFALDVLEVREKLDQFGAELKIAPQRVRLLLSRSGSIQLTSSAQDLNAGFPDISFARAPMDSSNPFLYHKTTHRVVYEEALDACPGAADVLLFNEEGHVTESTIANLVVDLGGELFTPPVECGLLPGTLRAHLIQEGKIRERKLTRDEVRQAPALYLMNSVRGFHPVRLADAPYNSVRARTGM